MKKYSLIVLALISCAFVCVLAASLMTSIKEYIAPSAVTSQTESYSAGFLLTVYDGFIAIKRIGEPEPYKVFDIPASVLSEYDRDLLSRGIYCSSLEEAMSKAEDFIG